MVSVMPTSLFQTLNTLYTYMILMLDCHYKAMHVNRYNHDSAYNPLLENDGIQHVHMNEFEEISRNLDEFMTSHGRKCVEYFHFFF